MESSANSRGSVAYSDEKKLGGKYSEIEIEVELSDFQKSALRLTINEAKGIIRGVIEGSNVKLDPNFDQNLLIRAREALDTEYLSHDVAQRLVEDLKLEASLLEISPYAEVRATVPASDDWTLPVNTFRVWILGLFFTIAGTGINTFYTARQPTIFLNSFCTQVLSYPAGVFLATVLPTYSIRIWNNEYSLNPGPFNLKEQTLITIMSSASYGSLGSFTSGILVVTRLPIFYGREENGSRIGYQLLLAISTQLVGFSFAGLCRRFLVYPPAAIWPANLATIVLNRSFHSTSNPVANGWSISRLNFFLVVFVVYGMYFALPSALFGAFENFNFITWFAPNNVLLAIVGGSVTGMGFTPLGTLDWSFATALVQPLISPLFSTVNQFIGMFIGGLVILLVYFTNTWYSAFLPISSDLPYDSFGMVYNVSRIVTPDFGVDIAAYDAYPVYQTAANAISFAAWFLTYSATIIHCLLYYHEELISGFKSIFSKVNARDQYNDYHNKAMRRYTDVPEWWFGIVLLLSVTLSVITNEIYATSLPIWFMMFGFGLSAVFLIPVGLIAAVSNVSITLNVLSELIAGFVLPGKPLAVMIFKNYVFVANSQAISYISDAKLGHYMKIPPMLTFWAQIISSVIGALVSIAVVDWQISNLPNFCEPGQVSGFSCPDYTVFYTSSILFGAVGPARLYAIHQIYSPALLGFALGIVMPLMVYFMAQRHPDSILRYVSIPALAFGASNWNPYNLTAYSAPLILALFFQGYVRSRYLPWWRKYCYILSCALTTSISIFGVIWFFAFLFHPIPALNSWWGNTISFAGLDGSGVAYYQLAAGETFGPHLEL